MTLSAGTKVSHYRVLSLLGAGGMGEAYLAEDTQLERKAAVKLLPAQFTQDEERVRRFILEAKAASALNHPNIITIHEIGEAEAGRFIAMEFVQGRTLREMIGELLSPEVLAATGGQIAKALAVAHEAGITHRDIKPENIMVRDDGYVKVLDFGLARLAPLAGSQSQVATLAQNTMPGTMLGTVAYMSPEQARGGAVTTATDIFALGIVFYELVTGEHPFKADSLLGMLHRIGSDSPAPPSCLNPAIPASLDGLILTMLQKEPGSRPAAAQVEKALAALAGGSSAGEIQRAVAPAAARHTVGRERERAELQAGFESALSGRGLLLCVAGEPGIGKTTLVEDFLSQLAAQGRCTVAHGRCSERLAGTEAYLPLLEALESLLQGGSNASAARVMKQIAPTWYAQVAPPSGEDEETARLINELRTASQERMKRELGAFLQEAARLRPLVLFLDDLHWADVSTIDMLSFLAGRFDTLNVLIVVTYRSSDLLIQKHPFLQIRPDLQARSVCRELTLEFLSQAEVAEYLDLAFPGHRFPSELPHLIHAKTEGSPLFMADLVRYLRDRGVVAVEESSQDANAHRWVLAQALTEIERDLPESVKGMIERKIGQLDEEDHKLLVAASVQGYEFDSAVVAEVLKIEADKAEERLEKLERVYAFVRLVSEKEFPNRTLTLRYRFVHVLYQNALYASLRTTRRVTLNREVAQALEGFYDKQRASVASELAVLWEASRDYKRAAEYFRLAAERATAHVDALERHLDHIGSINTNVKENKEDKMTDREQYAPGPASGAQVRKDGEKWTLILVRELRHSPEKVWQALTEPAHLREWAPFEADASLGTVGTTVKLSTVGAPTPQVSETRVTRAEAPKVLEYNWGAQDIRWELEASGGGTRLTLWHNINRGFISMGAAGWHICFDVLDHLLSGTPLGRIVGSDAMKFGGWQRLNAEYAKQFGVEPPAWPPNAPKR